MRLARGFLLTLALTALAACSVDPVPDVTYFRLPVPLALAHAGTPLSALPIEVETFRAEGIYAEQALIYATTPQADALRAFHYQLWSVPPSRALQARLTGMLRDSGIAPLVTERLPASTLALRVHGRIVRFERVPRDGGFAVVVVLELRVDQDQGEPLLERSYRAEVAAADAGMTASVNAYGRAIDKDFAAFYADLAALGNTHAG